MMKLGGRLLAYKVCSPGSLPQQQDCAELESTLGYLVNPTLVWAIETPTPQPKKVELGVVEHAFSTQEAESGNL